MCISPCFPDCLYQEDWSTPSSPSLPDCACCEEKEWGGVGKPDQTFYNDGSHNKMPVSTKRRAPLPAPPLEKHRARLCNGNSDHFCWGRAHRCGFSHVCNLGDGAEHLFFLMGVL